MGKLDPRDESHNAFVILVSDCCSSQPTIKDDMDDKNNGTCPVCGEQCEFVPEEEE